MLVLDGDGLETSASSHDLLASAVGNMFLLQTIPEVASSPLYQNRNAEKLKVLFGLYEANDKMLPATPHEHVPQEAYAMFQHAFRQFMTLYPGSHDLRFAPLDSVDSQSTVHAQAMQHLQAQATLTGDVLTIEPNTSYSELLRLYAQRMCAQ